MELLFQQACVSGALILTRDIDLTTDELSIRGKGSKVRLSFISDYAKKVLKEYLAKRKDLDDALFVQISKTANQWKKRGKSLGLTTPFCWRELEHYAIKAGISKSNTPQCAIFCHRPASNGFICVVFKPSYRSRQHRHKPKSTPMSPIKHLRDIHKKFHNKRS